MKQLLKTTRLVLYSARGQTFVEYALAIILVSLAVGVAMGLLSGAIGDKIGEMVTRVQEIGTP